MKKNFIINKGIFFIGLLAICLGGCFDLEETPISIVAPEVYFSTEDDVETAIFGAYTHFVSETVYGRQFTTVLAILDDICDILDPGTVLDRRNMNNLKVDPGCSMISTFWPRIFRAIGAANTAIDGVGKINITDQARANALEAEGRMIRAHCYFNLIRLFGDVPYLDEAVTDPKAVAEMSRTPITEIYPKLIEDCLFAIQWLPDKYPSNIRCRPTKGAAKTMLAYIYITLGDYANAAKYAVEVINERVNYGYELMADYTDLWDGAARTGDVAEYIWTIDFKEGTSDDMWAPMTGVRGGAGAREGVGGWSVVGPSHGYLAMFDTEDLRIESTFLLEGEMSVGTTSELQYYTEWVWTYNIARPHFGKYRKYPGALSDAEGRYSGRNFNFYRFAEVYLLAAEALTEVNNGPTTEALDYLNLIRQRAGVSNYASGMAKTEFINAVLKERMLEFGCEYKRWFDIVRRDLGAEVFGANTIETNMNANDGNGQHNSSMWTTKNYLLPIPQAELDRCPNLTQNHGY